MALPEDALLSRLVLHFKLATQAQLDAAVQAQAARPQSNVAEVLVSLGALTREQEAWLAGARKKVEANGGVFPGEGQAKPRPSAVPPGVSITAAAPAPAPAPRPSSPQPGPSGRSGSFPALTAPTPSAPAVGTRSGSFPAITAAAPVPAPAPSAPPAAAPAENGAPAEKISRKATVQDAQAASVKFSGGITLTQLLTKAVEFKASDVHVHALAPAQVRLAGQLVELKTGMLDPKATEAMLMEALPPDRREELRAGLDLDLAIDLPKLGRFRASFYKQQRGWDAVFRPIPIEVPSIDSLGLPPVLKKLADYHQGLVLVTGPAGSGKSSTLAALVRMLNESRTDHIITVEDPIEFVHKPAKCLVNQREVNRHTKSFANALRAALREDPDIIVIGELRDLETISLAITAAETGHLVLGTLHTNNAIRTINRILDAFPPKQQSQIRAMVSESLRAVFSQRLVPTVDAARRVVAYEMLLVKPSVSNLIRDEKTFQLRSVMQTGRADGMCLLDDSLAELVKAGRISKDAARRIAEDTKRFV